MTDFYPSQDVKWYSFEFSSFTFFYTTSVIIKRSLQKPERMQVAGENSLFQGETLSGTLNRGGEGVRGQQLKLDENVFLVSHS